MRAPRLAKSALALLAELARGGVGREGSEAALLVARDLVRRGPGGLAITEAGRAFLARAAATGDAAVGPFRAQHLDVARRRIAMDDGVADVLVDDGESPLAWLARRKGRDGQPMIEPVQLLAGERLRGDFTCAHLTPRVTASWDPTVVQGRRNGSAQAAFADTVIAARERVSRALDSVGPEFSGLLLDVCCFLKGLEEVERERRWPPRSAKVVLQLGLARLARHYGLAREARGRTHAPIRAWAGSDNACAAEGG